MGQSRAPQKLNDINALHHRYFSAEGQPPGGEVYVEY